jgi:hypothetical protein
MLVNVAWRTSRYIEVDADDYPGGDPQNGQ